LQTDGYVAYEKVGGPGLVHAGCWAHCRRGFANVAADGCGKNSPQLCRGRYLKDCPSA
jgi:hypothetical protein